LVVSGTDCQGNRTELEKGQFHMHKRKSPPEVKSN
jgi:hypothetical protein